MTDQLFDLQFQIHGFRIFKDVIPADRCSEIRQRVVETVESNYATYESGKKAAGTGIGFTPSIINHDQSFAEYLADPKLLDFIGRLLGEHVRISFSSAIINERGNQRGDWHADWPFNQKTAGHVKAPYPDTIMHITTLWMLSPFDADNGGTLILPGSHRCPTNPTASGQVDPTTIFDNEINATGSAGSVLVMDSRLWHATARNRSNEARVALAVRYAPWWLNLDVLRPGTDERRRIVDEPGATANLVAPVRRDVFERLPDKVKPLFRHWVDRTASEASS